MEKIPLQNIEPEQKINPINLESLSRDNTETIESIDKKSLLAKLGNKWLQRAVLLIGLLGGAGKVSADEEARSIFDEYIKTPAKIKISESMESSKMHLRNVIKDLETNPENKKFKKEYYTLAMRNRLNDSQEVPVHMGDIGGIIRKKGKSSEQVNFSGLTNVFFTAIKKEKTKLIDASKPATPNEVVETEYYFDYDNDGSINRIIIVPEGKMNEEIDNNIFNYVGVIDIERVKKMAKNMSENNLKPDQADPLALALKNATVMDMKLQDFDIDTVNFNSEKPSGKIESAENLAEKLQLNYESVVTSARVVSSQ